MTTRRHRRTALPLSAALVAFALVILAAVLVLTRPAPVPDVAATPAPAPSPAPTPPPPPDPVVGTLAEVALLDLSVTGSGLHASGSAADQPESVDEPAVDDAARGVVAWLDAHLTDLQDGGAGSLDSDALVGPVEALRLTGPDAPVRTASYHLTVGTRGAPEWIDARVAVVLADGTQRSAALTFLPGDPPVVAAASGDGPVDGGSP